MRSSAHTEQDIGFLAIYYYTRFPWICQIIGLLLDSVVGLATRGLRSVEEVSCLACPRDRR